MWAVKVLGGIDKQDYYGSGYLLLTVIITALYINSVVSVPVR
jgi:hypothetical protein